MKKVMPVLACLGPVFMFFTSIAMIVFFGFDVNSNMDQPPIPLYIEPAGYAFITWNLIDIGFIALGVYQLSPKYKDDPRFVTGRKYIVVNSLANAAWFVGVIQNQFWLTVTFMLILLYTLIRLAVIFKLGERGKDWRERLWIKLPLALYFGWITLATPINIASFLLTEVGWTGQAFLTPQIWSVAILTVAVGIVFVMYITKKANAVYLFVGVWGLLAIFVANSYRENLVSLFAIVLAILLLFVFAVTKIVFRKYYAVL